jgi:hypothetical protein
MPTTNPSLCAAPTCPQEATHGVYYRAYQRRWTATRRTDLPRKAPHHYCHWHAVVQAVCRNAGEEVPHALCS